MAGGYGGGEHLAVAVLMLEPFSGERGASGGGAHQEAFAPAVGEGPDEVGDALEAEHRVVGEEWNHRRAVVGVGRAGGGERAHGAGFGDALFENLTVYHLLVEQEDVGIVRGVKLTHGGVNTHLTEKRLHAKGSRFVGHDGNDVFAERRILNQGGEDTDERHRGGNRAGSGAGERFFEQFESRSGKGDWFGATGRDATAKGCSTLAHVDHLRGIVGGLE